MCNQAAIQSLTQLPLEVFTKKERERIMQSWSLDVLTESPECYPAVLALKLKIMHRPTFYKVCIITESLSVTNSLLGYEIHGFRGSRKICQESQVRGDS